MFQGIQFWLCSDVEDTWVITETGNVEKDDGTGLCRGQTKNEDPTSWEEDF
jgi:hypothetical protein